MTFSPDSTYAAWSDDERAAADRMEKLFNQSTRCQLGKLVHTQYIRVAPDDSLRRLTTVHHHELEGITTGDVIGGDKRARLAKARLTDIEREQEFRAALAKSWLASDNGTHCYTGFVARGGLAAVAHHGAPQPSFQLAALLDRLNWAQGRPHVLSWGDLPNHADHHRGVPQPAAGPSGTCDQHGQASSPRPAVTPTASGPPPWRSP